MTGPLGRSADSDDDTLVEVRLLATPVRVWQRTAEHHDELMREFALMALGPSATPLPARLLALVDIFGRRYGAAGARPDDVRDAALDQAKDRLDLTFDVPRSTAVSALRMRELLDEAELFCWEHLLTLAQPKVQSDFARWWVVQFVDQCKGGPATPWPGPWD